ncbi:MAG: amidohydrolase family protein [Alphaproteobacteria bacterium]
MSFAVPKGAGDCHVHVFLDPGLYPFAEERVYTPPEASAAALLTLQSALQLDRVVIVQPSVYGTDNAATIEGIRALGLARARGVAVIDHNTSASELDVMGRAGVRGVRVNLELAGEVDPARSAKKLRDTAEQIRGRGWHIQIYTQLWMIAALRDCLADLAVPLAIDHFGGARAELGPAQPGFDALLSLVRSGKAYVKVSGAYRCSSAAPAYSDVASLARPLIAANADRIVWGSDWPHPDGSRVEGRSPYAVTPCFSIDDGALLNLLPTWAGDAETRRKILVDNPARLYDF